MIWPSSYSACGIQISWPKHSVIRLASVDLPLPGAPYRNMPAPELMAGPRLSNRFGSTEMPRTASASFSGPGASAVIDWASTEIT